MQNSALIFNYILMIITEDRLSSTVLIFVAIKAFNRFVRKTSQGENSQYGPLVSSCCLFANVTNCCLWQSHRPCVSRATGQRCVSLKTSSFPGIFGINLFLNIKSIDAFIL